MLLLDTHVVLWVAQQPSMLSKGAYDGLRATRETDALAISDKTLWELAMMISRNYVRVRTSTRDFLQEVERHFRVLPISAAIAERSVLFSPRYPKDPSDRVIGATALVHSLQLVTADEDIRASGEVPCLW